MTDTQDPTREYYNYGGEMVIVPTIVELIQMFDPYYKSKALTLQERRVIMIADAKKAREQRDNKQENNDNRKTSYKKKAYRQIL